MVRVAVAQIKITKSSNKNFNRIIKYIKKASLKKAKIVCFPETSLIHNKNRVTLKKIPIKNYINKIKVYCKENKIYCIFGTNIFEKNKVYNSAFFIDNKGKLIYRYNKVNLFKKEIKKVTAGKTNKTINTEFGKIGILICWDIAYPEFVKKLAKKGAWLIFCPSYVKDYGREAEPYLQLPLSRAFENSCYFVFCDAYAKDTIKYSYICSPSKIIKKIKNKEGLIIADLDRRKIVGLRRYYGLV